MITQALLNCALTAVLGEAATTVLKIIGITQNADSFIEAVKSGDPERIIVESLRLAVSVYALKSQCFTGDTLVSTADGDRRIDEIEAGDYVWSYDTELDEKVLAKVTNVSVTETDVLVHVITSEGDDIRTTMFHPFYVKDLENGGDGIWVAASNLIKGQELLTEDGKIVYVEEINTERLLENIKVYNLEIKEVHNYYANEVLVHNGCKIGENGTQTTSTTVGKNGSTERIDVENPKPGIMEGNMHYHEPNNTKWYYEFDLDQLVDKKGNLAPKAIQAVLNMPWAIKAIKKGKKYLGI